MTSSKKRIGRPTTTDPRVHRYNFKLTTEENIRFKQMLCKAGLEHNRSRFIVKRIFAEEFGRALAAADLVVLTDVYPAREEPEPGVTGELVVDAARAAGADVRYVPDKTGLPAALADLVRGGDLVMTLGAGDITRVGPALLERLGASRS